MDKYNVNLDKQFRENIEIPLNEKALPRTRTMLELDEKIIKENKLLRIIPSNDIINSEIKQNDNSHIIYKIIESIHKTVKNRNDAINKFYDSIFLHILSEDQVNSEIFGNSSADQLHIFTNSMLPYYISDLQVKTEAKNKIMAFYKHASNIILTIDTTITEKFNLEDFYKTMKNDYFNSDPRISLNNDTKYPCEYIYEKYMSSLNQNGYLFLFLNVELHAISSVIYYDKKNSVYYVSIINTGPGSEYTKTEVIDAGKKHGYYDIYTQGIITFKIKNKKCVRRFIYIMTNYYHCIYSSYPLDPNKLYQILIPILLTNDNGDLIKNNKIFKVDDSNINKLFLSDFCDKDYTVTYPIQSSMTCYYRAITIPIICLLKYFDNSVDINVYKYIYYNWFKYIQQCEVFRTMYLIYHYNLSEPKYQNIFTEIMESQNHNIKSIDRINQSFQSSSNREIKQYFEGLQRSQNRDIDNSMPGYKRKIKTIKSTIVIYQKNIIKLFTRRMSGYDVENNYTIMHDTGYHIPLELPRQNYIVREKDIIDKRKLFNDFYNFNIKNPCNHIEEMNNYLIKIINFFVKTEDSNHEILEGAELHIYGNIILIKIEDLIKELYDIVFPVRYGLTWSCSSVAGDKPSIENIDYLYSILTYYIKIRVRVPVYSPNFDQSPLHCLGILQIMGKILDIKSASAEKDIHNNSILYERISSTIITSSKNKDFYNKLKENNNYSDNFIMKTDYGNTMTNKDPNDSLSLSEILKRKCFYYYESIYTKKIIETITAELRGDYIERINSLIYLGLDDDESYLLHILFSSWAKKVKNNYDQDLTYINDILIQYNYIKSILKIIHLCNIPIMPFFGSIKFPLGNEDLFDIENYGHYFLKNEHYETKYNKIIVNDYTLYYYLYMSSFLNDIPYSPDHINMSYANNDVFQNFLKENKLPLPSSGKLNDEIIKCFDDSEYDKLYNINYKTIANNFISYSSDFYKNITEVHPFMIDNINNINNITDKAHYKDLYQKDKKLITSERRYMMSWYIYLLDAYKTDPTIIDSLPLESISVIVNDVKNEKFEYERLNINTILLSSLINSNMNKNLNLLDYINPEYVSDMVFYDKILQFTEQKDWIKESVSVIQNIKDKYGKIDFDKSDCKKYNFISNIYRTIFFLERINFYKNYYMVFLNIILNKYCSSGEKDIIDKININKTTFSVRDKHYKEHIDKELNNTYIHNNNIYDEDTQKKSMT